MSKFHSPHHTYLLSFVGDWHGHDETKVAKSFK